MPESAGIRTNADSHSTPRFPTFEPGFVHRNLWLLQRAVVAAQEDNCFGIAKGAAYSFLLSLFPVLTTLTAILFEVNAESVVHLMATFIREIVPPGTEEMILSRLRQRGLKPISVPVISILLGLWAGSGAMISLMDGFEAAYRIPSGRPFLKQRAMAIFLVLTAALPTVAASLLIIFGDRGEAAFRQWAGYTEISTQVHLTWRFARYAVAFSTTTFVTGLLYYFGPNHRPEPERTRNIAGSRFTRVWPGALVATVLWLLATAGFAWYVGHVAHYNILYGSIWTVVVLLIWLYLIACITMIGCEFNAERERIASVPLTNQLGNLPQ